MERSLDANLIELKSLILSMGGHVEQALDVAIQALLDRNVSQFSEIFEIEEKINEEHVLVDNACLTTLAKQGPMAKDLRLIFSIIKINSDLERMGDQTVNISYNAKDYLSRPFVALPSEISEMTQLVRRMVKEALDSFVREDVELAKSVLLLDDEVDMRKSAVFNRAVSEIQTKPEQAFSAIDVILIARNLERLGDHATNIAEDVIFLSTGKDVRHGGKYSPRR